MVNKRRLFGINKSTSLIHRNEGAGGIARGVWRSTFFKETCLKNHWGSGRIKGWFTRRSILFFRWQLLLISGRGIISEETFGVVFYIEPNICPQLTCKALHLPLQIC